MMNNSRPCKSLRQNSAATGTTASSGDSKTYKGYFFALPKAPGVRQSARRRGGFWDGNWISFTLMLPFILLFVARVPLGISDAFLMGDRGDADYNLCMMLALLLGSAAFLVHTLACL